MHTKINCFTLNYYTNQLNYSLLFSLCKCGYMISTVNFFPKLSIRGHAAHAAHAAHATHNRDGGIGDFCATLHLTTSLGKQKIDPSFPLLPLGSSIVASHPPKDTHLQTWPSHLLSSPSGIHHYPLLLFSLQILPILLTSEFLCHLYTLTKSTGLSAALFIRYYSCYHSTTFTYTDQR